MLYIFVNLFFLFDIEDVFGIVCVFVSRGCYYCKGWNDNICEDFYCFGCKL